MTFIFHPNYTNKKYLTGIFPQDLTFLHFPIFILYTTRDQL